MRFHICQTVNIEHIIMTLKEIGLKKDNHFIAMEYYGLILNRTFLVLITEEHLIGLKVHGLIVSNIPFDPTSILDIAATVLENLVDSTDQDNPYSYVKDRYLRKVENLDVQGDEILAAYRSNFRINRSDITKVSHDPTKKWGMWEYPHDGKVNIKTTNGSSREFIILAKQSGEQIAQWIK